MPKKAKELSAIVVKRLTKPGLHAVGGIAGLHLQITETGARSWILKVIVGAKRREIGLGSYPGISLADARVKAIDLRNKIAQGIDPVMEKREARNRLIAQQAAEITFKSTAEEFINSKKAEWKNEKHLYQWETTLKMYAYPHIGTTQVKDIELSHILKVLQPIWETKTETASRLRGRIENILGWATVKNYRSGENPARWKGYLDKVLPSPSKIVKVEHHKALPLKEMANFFSKLKNNDGLASRALEFLILTAARSGEVRGAKWDEIDTKKKVWTIPGVRMKAGKEHRIPLTPEALSILSMLPRFENEDHIFPAPRGGKLSDVALIAVMRRMNVDAVPHGFRSTFRDWVAECTNYPREVAEMALAHTIESKVEAAYRRGDLFEKRREMMREWEAFCMKIYS